MQEKEHQKMTPATVHATLSRARRAKVPLTMDGFAEPKNSERSASAW